MEKTIPKFEVLENTNLERILKILEDQLAVLKAVTGPACNPMVFVQDPNGGER